MIGYSNAANLSLKELTKNASENVVCLSSAANDCLVLLTNLSIETNNVYPDQTAAIGAV